VSGGPECEQIRELLPEFAAGVLTGPERAEVLGHVDGCAGCRRELAGLAEMVDELLHLAPEREPPAGLESKVLARLEPPIPVRSGRMLNVPATMAAAVLTAVLAAGLVWWRTADDRRLAAEYRHTMRVAHGQGLSVAPLLRTRGVEVGTVFACQGRPAWVYVTFRSQPPTGRYLVWMVTSDGHRTTLHPLTVQPGTAAWGSTVQVTIRDIRALEFVRSGVPVMAASFS